LETAILASAMVTDSGRVAWPTDMAGTLAGDSVVVCEVQSVPAAGPRWR